VKLKVTYQSSAGAAVDIAVTTDATATIGDIAGEILMSDPRRSRDPGAVGGVTLSAAPPGSGEFTVLDAEKALTDAPIASGYTVQVVASRPASAPSRSGRPPAVAVTVEVGPDAGKRFLLPPGTHFIGRNPHCDVVLSDALVSKTHARLEVGPTVELVDLNSANGILVDGGMVSRLAVVDGQSLVLGDTTLTFAVAAGIDAAVARQITQASLPFTRTPRVEPRYPGQEFPAPEIPNEFEKPLFPWLLMLVPLALGLTVFLVTKNPLSLLFVALSPMMMVGNYLMGRRRVARQRDSAIGRFEAQLAALEAKLAAEVPHERAVRDQEAPSVRYALAAAEAGDPLLWTRRPEHWQFLHVRWGTGRSPSRNTVSEPRNSQGLPEFAERVQQLIDRHRTIDAVPIVEDPRVAGGLGVVGEPEQAYDITRALLTQWIALHSPAELVVTALTGAQGAHELEWLKWLPHTSSTFSPIPGPHLADGAATAATLLAQLEELVGERLARAEKADEYRPALESQLRAVSAGSRVGEKDGEWKPPLLPAVVVLVTHDAPVDRGRMIQLLERAAAAGVVPLFVSPSASQLPAACRTFVELTGGPTGRVHFVRHGTTVEHVVVEGVSRAEASRLGRALSGFVDEGAAKADASDLPLTMPILALLGPDMAGDGSAVIDRWQQNFSLAVAAAVRPANRPPTLRALVGSTGADAMHLDLRAQGPHALVGGTTGSGKSEFLQAWVLGMAAEYSPQRVTFLFVDYKGGSAFAECVKLPHCVGLVTDLDQHLVRRALTSLRAELRHREEVLNHRKAKDLLELEERGDPSCPPALILVIDEFAALVGEVPEFVDGVVDIAQRGRSLGIHLIMATQRPAGVIRDNLRANTNLRIALRMNDEADSVDVVGSAEAARFDPTLPGRAIAKTGPGRLVQFQSAYAGGWSSPEEDRPEILIHDLRFGAETPWRRDAEPAAPREAGPNDQARLVKALGSAARATRVAHPRRPWLDALERSYDLIELGPTTDAELVLGLSDLPQDQDQAPVHFTPDEDGHLLVYGTGGSGKSAVLRTLAAGAGITPTGGPVEVYALDFSSGGLRMLEVLPHVGSVIPGDDSQRVARLLRTLKTELERRGRDYSQVDADSITRYREIARRPDEPRILLLLDGYPAFRAEYEAPLGRSQWYAVFQQLLTEGRQLGIHVALTADRPAAVPGAVSASVPRRLVLRLADEAMYAMLDVPNDVLNPGSPPGRGVLDQLEVQVAILGGQGTAADQSRAMRRLAHMLTASGRTPARPIRSMPMEFALEVLPREVLGRPVLGISGDDLLPCGFAPEGVMLLGGGPTSGRSNGLRAIVRSLGRWNPGMSLHYFGARRSTLVNESGISGVAVGPDEVAEAARALAAELALHDLERQPTGVIIEAVADFLHSPADSALVDLVKTVKRTGHLLVAESETGTWRSSFTLLSEIKSGRRGVLLQPDSLEGEAILGTAFPKVSRNEFPPGRGYLVNGGKAVMIQLPKVDG